jgi:hypothetical protein
VASLVAEITDDKSLPKPVRKDKQIETAPHKSDIASVIKLADKTSNLRALAKNPPPWPIERKRLALGSVPWHSAIADLD